MSIQVQHIGKQYGRQWAVNKVSFAVDKGMIVGFLGPNGAGKSTTMKMITGFVQPTTGNATVCGLSVENNRREAQKKIGYLPENNPLYYDLYVGEFLTTCAQMHQLAKPKAAIERVVEETGLTRERHKKIAALSKGYKQRVGLAQALLHNPEVLILDEPTSGLDPNQLEDIRGLIKRIGKEKTVLLSTHIMQEVEALCERVIIINKGNVVADDTVDAVRLARARGQRIRLRFANDVNLNDSPWKAKKEKGFWVVWDNEEDLALRFFQYCVKHNYVLTHLEEITPDLEATFKELTTA